MADITTISNFDTKQKKIERSLAYYLQEGMMGGRPEGLPAYEGELVAGLTDQQKRAQDLVSAYADNIGTGAGTEISREVQGLFSDLRNPETARAEYDEFIAPFLQKQREDADALATEKGLGTAGTRLATGVNRMRQDAQQDITMQNAALLQQQILGNRQLAAQLAPVAMSAEQYEAESPLRAAEALYAGGGLERAAAQEQLTATYNEFMRTTPELSPLIQQSMQFLGLNAQSAVVTPEKVPDWVTAAQLGIGALSGGGALAAGIGSYYAGSGGGTTTNGNNAPAGWDVVNY